MRLYEFLYDRVEDVKHDEGLVAYRSVAMRHARGYAVKVPPPDVAALTAYGGLMKYLGLGIWIIETVPGFNITLS